MNELLDGFGCRDRGADDDHNDDQQGGDVLEAPVAGREPPGRRPAHEREGEEKGSQDIARVVEPIREDAGGATGGRGENLDQRGDPKRHCADYHRPDSVFVALVGG